MGFIDKHAKVIGDSGIYKIIDSNSVDYLRGYRDGMVEMSNHTMQDAIDKDTENLEAAALLEILINEKVQKEE
jgi:hypothetical protein